MDAAVDKKIAIVTGASRGIGKAICLGLAEDGYDIWLTYLSNVDSAHETATAVQEIGRECLCLKFNVADYAETANALTPLLKKNIPDVLVNNAGTSNDGVFALMSQSAWSEVIETNLTGFYNVTHTVLPAMMRRRKGRIISIASISGQAGNAGQVNYSAAKGAIIGASKALAREVARRGILVNVVSPGLIETDMTRDLPRDQLIGHIPLRRFGQPADVAGCVRFLCSEWADYITGQVIAVNGGMYM